MIMHKKIYIQLLLINLLSIIGFARKSQPILVFANHARYYVIPEHFLDLRQKDHLICLIF